MVAVVAQGSSSRGRAPQGRGSVRLRLAVHAADNRLDGGWWPRSTDLAVELADLVTQLPAELGAVVHALVPASDWDPVPEAVETPLPGVIRVETSRTRVPHLLRLTTSSGLVLDLLVVPAWFTRGQGEEALLASATAGNIHAATELLHEVIEQPEGDPRNEWSGRSGSWWESTHVDARSTDEA